jgi:hypothetical protein
LLSSPKREIRELREYETHLATLEIPKRVRRDERVELGRLVGFAQFWEPYTTFDHFVDRYYDLNQATCLMLQQDEYREGVEARLARAFPSLAREHHLYLLLRSIYKTVLRTPEVDYSWGIDALVIVGPTVYSVNAYVDTRRSNHFRERKKVRHPGYESVGIPVELPLDMAKARKIGDLFVYQESDLTPLEEAILDGPLAQAA